MVMYERAYIAHFPTCCLDVVVPSMGHGMARLQHNGGDQNRVQFASFWKRRCQASGHGDAPWPVGTLKWRPKSPEM